MADSVALSALDWWAEAGVDTLAEESPRNWLASPVAPAPSQTAPVALTPASVALPATLDAFRQWLLSDAAVPGAARGRLDAAGDPASGTIVVVDMPESEDRAAGSLLSGEVGALFDRMLGAIALGRTDLYLVPFSPVRPTTGRLSESDSAALKPLLLHHLRLANPRRLLVLGDAPVQALLGRPAAQARDTVHQVTIGDAQVATVASIHPRIVHARREYRALAWADLQRFAAL